MTTTHLTALAERVETGGPEGDAELDGAIFDALSGPGLGSARETVLDRRARPIWLPHYTTSLDACLALIAAKLPGVPWGVGCDDEGAPGAFVGDHVATGGKGYARPLLAATLRALAQQEKDNAKCP